MRYLFLFIIIMIFSCQQGEVSKITQSDFVYLNHHDSVAYVGKETCKECHYDIYNSYMRTGMGQSFHHATKTKSLLDSKCRAAANYNGTFGVAIFLLRTIGVKSWKLILDCVMVLMLF